MPRTMPQQSQESAGKALREMPDHWLSMIVHYVTGLQNSTGQQDFSQPIIKPDLVDIYPIFIVQYSVLAVLSVIANVLLIYYILRNKLYRDCTHAFLVNLSISHLIQCCFVLPTTLMVIVIQNWVYGQFMCFFMPLLQDIPMHVAILSHMLIAFDRMRWLGDPMKQRLPSFVCSCATWLTGMIIALPYPIYTTYLDLGLYLPKFRGVGLCAFNLVDDMQEYMRGLFIIMYCGPCVLLSYLYIRTSRELRPPEGALSVMMFEHRAQVVSRQRTSSNTPSATRTGTRTNYARTYDLYDAEMDVTREKRTQCHLGTMAAVQLTGICPLMILRIARMVLVETYENSMQFDITYLLFIWAAFLPTFINPCIYVAWVLPRPMKDRLRAYFRISSRSGTKMADNADHRTSDLSTTQEVTTETIDEQFPFQDPLTSANTRPRAAPNTTNSNRRTTFRDDDDVEVFRTPSKTRRGVNRSTEVRPTNLNRISCELSGSIKDRLALVNRSTSRDVIDKSCSNITTSTYCNGIEPHPLQTRLEEIEYYHDMEREKQRQPIRAKNINHPLRVSQERLRTSQDSDLDHHMCRRESSSTYERDMDIIDLLQRERSMEINPMLDPDDHHRDTQPILRHINRQSTSAERQHRRLPDISRLASTHLGSTNANEIPPQFPNQIFTHQAPIDITPIPSGRNQVLVSAKVSSRPTSQIYYPSAKRDSVHSVGKLSARSVDMEPVVARPPSRTSEHIRDHQPRLGRTHSNHSSSSSTGRCSSIKGRREYRESSYATNL